MLPGDDVLNVMRKVAVTLRQAAVFATIFRPLPNLSAGFSIHPNGGPDPVAVAP